MRTRVQSFSFHIMFILFPSVSIRRFFAGPLPWKLLLSLPGAFLLACSTAHGPPFPPGTPNLPPPPPGLYRFQPPVPFFSRELVGEAVVEPAEGNSWAPMALRWAGRLRNGSLRIRSYQGRAIRLLQKDDKGREREVLEFQAQRCFVYGKKEIEERLRPLEMWDCDHLIYQFEKHKERGEILYSPLDSERTTHSRWSGSLLLHPLPGAEIRRSLSPPHNWAPGANKRLFVGQVMEVDSSGQLLLFGHQAYRLLRKDFPLVITDEKGRVRGRARVLSLPGEFVRARWEEGGEIAPGESRTGWLVYSPKSIVRKGWLE